MFDVPDEVSAQWAPVAAAHGAVAVDNSGAFRMDPEVPLVVPEVNPAEAANRPKGIIANPNCTTLSLIVAVAALHREFGLREMVGGLLPGGVRGGPGRHRHALRPARQGGGHQALGQRPGDVRAAVGDLGPFPAPLAMNVVPWAGSVKDDGWSSEELKVRNESRKILGLPDLRVSATCVRVPVITTHSVAVHAVFGREVERAAGAAGAAGRARRGAHRRPASTASSRPRPTWWAPTRPGWAGCAVPWTTRTPWSCSSAATTCARAPR